MPEPLQLDELRFQRGRVPNARIIFEATPSLDARITRALEQGFLEATSKSELLRWLVQDALTRVEQAWVDAKVREAAIDAALQE